MPLWRCACRDFLLLEWARGLSAGDLVGERVLIEFTERGGTAAALKLLERSGPGFELLSLFVGDVDETLAKLGDAAKELRRIEVDSPQGPVPMVTVRDPDGVLVEIIGLPQRR